MKVRIRINKNKKFKKLCFFLVNPKGDYEGYVDSVYYDKAGNSHINNLWDYPHIMLHGKVVPRGEEFFKAIFEELRKYIKTFTISTNRKCAEEFLRMNKDVLKIKEIGKTEFESIWSFV